MYKHNTSNTSFGYKGILADRVYLELLLHHRQIKQENDPEKIISPAHRFWFEELPSYKGYYCRNPIPDEGDFQNYLAIAQGLID